MYIAFQGLDSLFDTKNDQDENRVVKITLVEINKPR